MSENQPLSGREFVLRVLTVAAAAILVVFCVKIWIVDPLAGSAAPEKQEGLQPVESQAPQAADFDKTKHKISYQDAPAYLGKYVEIEGEIVSSYNNGKVCYLNFNKNYREYLALVIFASNYNRFPEKPEKHYLNKKVRVEGRIKDYKGRLEIVLGSQEQIVIVE